MTRTKMTTNGTTIPTTMAIVLSLTARKKDTFVYKNSHKQKKIQSYSCIYVSYPTVGFPKHLISCIYILNIITIKSL